MNLFSRETYDQKTIVKIVAFVDLIQSCLILMARASGIIFRSMLSEEDSLVRQQNQSSIFVVLLFVVSVFFYMAHISFALKLLSALELMEKDVLMAARNAKAWQNWSVLVLVFLVGNLIASTLSASTKLAIVGLTIFAICEILWRLFGIYNVGMFIDELITNIPNLIPTVQFFYVRFPFSASSRSLERI